MAKYHINLNTNLSHASQEREMKRQIFSEAESLALTRALTPAEAAAAFSLAPTRESLALSAGENIARMMIYGQRFGMLKNQVQDNREQEGGTSHITGLPIWGSVTLSYPNLPDLVFTIVLIDVSMTRNIVTTALVGADGEVKEYISDKDFEVNLKCQIVGNGPDFYPADEIADIQKMLQIKDNLCVYSDIINNYGIQNLVIKDYQYTQDEGMRNVVQLSISAIADNPENYYAIIN